MEIKKFVLPLQSQSGTGALVQLVRIRACHARGQGFESPTHRREDDLKKSSFFCVRHSLVLGQRGIGVIERQAVATQPIDSAYPTCALLKPAESVQVLSEIIFYLFIHTAKKSPLSLSDRGDYNRRETLLKML